MDINFKSADYVISDVKRFLKSYDSVNAIDEGEFPTYIKHVLAPLGRGVMKFSEALIKADNSPLILPEDFKEISDAYRCKDTTTKHFGKAHEQSRMVLYDDITKDLIYTDKNCCIDCFENNHKVIERVTIKRMVEDSGCIYNFSYPTPLHITNKSVDIFNSSNFSINNAHENEIAIEDNRLYLNFTDDWVYIRYYGFPLDEFGVPLVPDINAVHQAIKWYIIYQIALSWWWNNDVPDIQNKWQQAEAEYKKWSAEASYYVKLPSFNQVIEASKLNKRAGLYRFFTNNIR
jgi:hypothetical protein